MNISIRGMFFLLKKKLFKVKCLKMFFKLLQSLIACCKIPIYKTFTETHICQPFSASLFIGYIYIIHISKAQVL